MWWNKEKKGEMIKDVQFLAVNSIKDGDVVRHYIFYKDHNGDFQIAEQVSKTKEVSDE